MLETGIEILRAAIIGATFLYLRSSERKEPFRLGKGWILIVIGFGLLLFGALLDITDNFPSLSKYVIIGKTKYEDFLEDVGYFSVLSSLRLASGNGCLRFLPSEKKRSP